MNYSQSWKSPAITDEMVSVAREIGDLTTSAELNSGRGIKAQRTRYARTPDAAMDSPTSEERRIDVAQARSPSPTDSN